jgi:vitamin-K-epoxide reductase (warfarin-sensitive)
MKYLIALLALAGAVVSAKALHVHMMDPGLAPPCAVSERWDCGTVNHSRYAVLPPLSFDEAADPALAAKHIHIPVATLGIIGYAVMAVAALLGRLFFVLELAQIGFFFALFLTFIEAFLIEKWCIYCVWSQSIVAAILLVTAVTLIAQGRLFRGLFQRTS